MKICSHFYEIKTKKNRWIEIILACEACETITICVEKSRKRRGKKAESLSILLIKPLTHSNFIWLFALEFYSNVGKVGPVLIKMLSNFCCHSNDYLFLFGECAVTIFVGSAYWNGLTGQKSVPLSSLFMLMLNGTSKGLRMTCEKGVSWVVDTVH